MAGAGKRQQARSGETGKSAHKTWRRFTGVTLGENGEDLVWVGADDDHYHYHGIRYEGARQLRKEAMVTPITPRKGKKRRPFTSRLSSLRSLVVTLLLYETGNG
ncbi:hypothetical protein E2C01_056413 [Portunus trituberculatus]|uniref:Uncharacterized protein n=1 Tax=Portunus trituberculatus TaxID=210409 RepID=A0A5B7GXM6_PORTR|nr:hypothetical protein [Portunus trituberculatus]